MGFIGDESLKHLVWRLRKLRNQKLATEILWLAADQRLEWLADGRVAFWTKAPEVLAHLEDERKTPFNVKLARPLWVEPTRLPPSAGPAAWCAVDPKAILASRKVGRVRLRVQLRELTVLVRLEEEGSARGRAAGQKSLGRGLSDGNTPVTGPRIISRSMLALLGRQ